MKKNKTKLSIIFVTIFSLFFLLSSCIFNIFSDEDAEKINVVYNSIVSKIDKNYLITNFSAPTKYDGVTITYISNNEDSLYFNNEEGIVIQKEYGVTVAVTVKLTYYSTKKTYNLIVKIPALEDVLSTIDQELLDEATNTLNSLITPLTASSITSNFFVPSTLIDNKVIVTYDSSNYNVVGGFINTISLNTYQTLIIVNRPFYEDEHINLTALISVPSSLDPSKIVTTTVAYNLVILKYENNVPDNYLIWDDIISNFYKHDNMTLDYDLEFNYAIDLTSSISFSSSNTDIISNTGIVSRPSKDTIVSITATICDLTYGDDARVFNFIVLASSLVSSPTLSFLYSTIEDNLNIANNRNDFVIDDLTFVKEFSDTNIKAVYQSSNPSFLTNEGIITKNNNFNYIVLSVILLDIDMFDIKTYNLTILPNNYDLNVFDFSGVWNEIENNLYLDILQGNEVTSNLLFDNEFSSYNVTALYSSNKKSVITDNGFVLRQTNDVLVTITITLKHNNTTNSRNYQFLVLQQDTHNYTSYSPYPYQNGGGNGVYSTNIELLDDKMSYLNKNIGLPSVEPNTNSNISLNVLVIPIAFSDYSFTSANLSLIEKGFFGTSADTGWESVSSFYNKSSFSKVSFNGVVLSPYTYNVTASKFASDYKVSGEYYSDYYAIRDSLNYHKNNIDFSSFDTNFDGLLDGIYLIYARPYETSNDLWWAYQYEYISTVVPAIGDLKYNNPGDTTYYRPSSYMWASYSFFLDKLGLPSIPINAETFIHETGHMFGFPDLYDYDKGNKNTGGLGGADMMDYNVGDHGPFNKIIWGWLTPQIVTSDAKIKLY
ncbi:MAG: hypothetical protein LBV51_01100, partial [Acholeplasmatales bacterium]|nr:hypothetical protein [Acholeplasmatales bacterium]